MKSSLLSFILLAFIISAQAQITSVDISCLQSQDIWSPAGTVGARNTYLTVAHNGDISFRVIWVPGSNFWRIEADADGNSSFETEAYTNTFASSPNPPDLNTGTWVDVAGCGPLSQFDGPYTQSSLTLPVTWGAINTSLLQGAVKLRWQTLSEQNNKHFIVQRSDDAVNFRDIATIVSQSVSSYDVADRVYEFIDNNPGTGRNFYRLVQVDIDDRRSFSIVVNIDNPHENVSLSLYPNPVKETVFIRGGSASRFEYSILNSVGHVIMQGNTATRSIDVSRLQSGLFILKTGSNTLKFLKN